MSEEQDQKDQPKLNLGAIDSTRKNVCPLSHKDQIQSIIQPGPKDY